MKKLLICLKIVSVVVLFSSCVNARLGDPTNTLNNNNDNNNNNNNNNNNGPSPIVCSISASADHVTRIYNNGIFYDLQGNEVPGSEDIEINMSVTQDGVPVQFVITGTNYQSDEIVIVNDPEGGATVTKTMDVRLIKAAINSLSVEVRKAADLTLIDNCDIDLELEGVPPGTITAVFEANSNDTRVEIPHNHPVNLYWDAANVTYCDVWLDDNDPINKHGVQDTHATGNHQNSNTQNFKDYIWNLRCTGYGNEIEKSVTVAVRPIPQPTIGARNLAGGPLELVELVVDHLDSFQIDWNNLFTDMLVCTVKRNGVVIAGGVSDTKDYYDVTSGATFEVSCQDSEEPLNTGTDSVVVTVNNPAPTADLKGETATSGLSDGPLTIAAGSTIDLTWTSTDADNCTIAPANKVNNWPGSNPPSGNDITTNVLNGDVTFTLTCTGPGGSAQDTLIVNVAPDPVINSFTSGLSTVREDDQSTNLSYSSSHASSCDILPKPPGHNQGGTSGSGIATGKLPVQTTYTLTCENSVGVSTSAQVTINIDPQHMIFVSSQTYTGNLGGLNGADAKCAQLAANAGLMPNHSNWKAILSSGGINAKDRFTITKKVRRACGDRNVFVYNQNQMWDTNNQYASVGCDENGVTRSSPAWTNTNRDGVRWGYVDANSCGNFTSSSSGWYSRTGNPQSLDDHDWIREGFSNIHCNNQRRIYCISQ